MPLDATEFHSAINRDKWRFFGWGIMAGLSVGVFVAASTFIWQGRITGELIRSLCAYKI